MDKDLRALSLFRNLTSQEIAPLRNVLTRKTVPAGVILMQQNDKSDAIHIVLDGTVKIHVERPPRADVILAICGADEILGELHGIDGQGHSASVTTLEPTTLYSLSRHDFLAALHCTPRLSFNLATHTTQRLRASSLRLQAMAQRDVRARLASQLLLFAERYGQGVPLSSTSGKNSHRPAPRAVEIQLRLTQTDLADLVGASRVRVNQVLSELRRQQLISMNQRHYITLLDQAKLATYCS